MAVKARKPVKKTTTGKRIIRGAREALAVARGQQIPARVTMLGWMVWSPSGLGSMVYRTKPNVFRGMGARAVRVKVTTE